jgi:putative transcriptional regulator
MTIAHHLDDATLMSFAAGSLPGALSAVAATHVAMCARCRRELDALERVGAALLATLAPAGLDRGEPSPPARSEPAPPAHAVAPPAPGLIPGPLAPLVGDLQAVQWRWIGPGVWQYSLPVKGAGRLALIKAEPGRGIPEHGHTGSELTLVLTGSLQDSTGLYRRGDVADLDEGIEHTPVADAEAGCICLVASEGSARFKGLLARLTQPYHGL